MALGASCIQFVLRRWGTLEVFYSENGAYPLAALGRGLTWQPGPLRAVVSPTALHLVFAACLVVVCAFTAGFATRYVKWLLLPVLFALDGRTPQLFTGGEAVLHGQALYAVLLPIGAAFSVDAWRSSRRPSSAPGSEPTAISSPVYPLLLLQLSVIYFFNQRAKGGASWQEGLAVAKALGAATLVTDFGAWLAHLPPVLLRSLTYGTLAIEGVLPLLLLSPWARKWTHIVAGALMLALHGGIYLALEVGSFSVAMLSYLPLLWHPRGAEQRVLVKTQRARRWQAAAAAGLLYVGAARLSHDLILWPDRPQLPMPRLLDDATRALGLVQPWMMFSPEPPGRDYIIVTDAVTQDGLHFDPWRQVASGTAEPFKALPQSVVRAHVFTRYENSLSQGARSGMHPFFARWVLTRPSPNQTPVERFDAWLMVISTDPERVVAANELETRVGVAALPFENSLPIKGFDAVGVWAPERAFDRKIVPEGTNVLTPVSASLSAGCPHLTLDLGEPYRLQSAFFQADSADLFWIEGSLDNKKFSPLAQMPRLPSRQHGSRIIGLPGEPTRFVRIRPVEPRALRHFLSEVAFFDHRVSLPTLTSRPDEDFYSSLARPAVAGIVSGSNHPSPECPAEDAAAMAAARAR